MAEPKTPSPDEDEDYEAALDIAHEYLTTGSLEILRVGKCLICEAPKKMATYGAIKKKAVGLGWYMQGKGYPDRVMIEHDDYLLFYREGQDLEYDEIIKQYEQMAD